MFVVDNVIRSATRNLTDNMSFLVINDSCSDYVERLAQSFPNHTFYVIQSFSGNSPQWDRPVAYENIKYYRSQEYMATKYCDAIICFNRVQAQDRAMQLSQRYHVPYINIDVASERQKYPVPFGATLNIGNPNSLRGKNGMISIGVEDFITESWKSENTKISPTIGMPFKQVTKNPNATKMLVDKSLPQEFFNSLPVDFNTNRFTNDINEAAMYCHFSSSPNCLLYDCMAAEIPVVGFNLTDMQKYYQLELCVMIKELQTLNKTDFCPEVCQLSESRGIAKRAREYAMAHNDMAQFQSKWDNIFKYLSNVIYQRGV